MKLIDLEQMSEQRENAGVKRLHEIFLQGGEPTNKEWEEGYSDAASEWERTGMEIYALLKALKVLDRDNFVKVWVEYKSNLAKEIIKGVEELELGETKIAH